MYQKSGWVKLLTSIYLTERRRTRHSQKAIFPSLLFFWTDSNGRGLLQKISSGLPQSLKILESHIELEEKISRPWKVLNLGHSPWNSLFPEIIKIICFLMIIIYFWCDVVGAVRSPALPRFELICATFFPAFRS